MAGSGFMTMNGRTIAIDGVWGTTGTWEELRLFIEEEDEEGKMEETDWERLKAHVESDDARFDMFLEMVKEKVFISPFDEALLAKVFDKYCMRYRGMPGWRDR